MMRSMWSGVEGLKTHQLEMDVIGNNIANVNSTSYKSQATGFSDIFYQTIKQGNGAGDNRATTNASQVGFGSRVASIMTNVTKQGSAVLTDNVLDLMITGDSFFCVKKDNTSTEINFSRDGALTIDADGYLVTQNSGLYVMGKTGEGGIDAGFDPSQGDNRLKVIDRRVARTGYSVGPGTDENPATKTIYVDVMEGESTKAAYMEGNLDSDDDSLEEGRIVSLEVYAKDGKIYTLNMQFDDAGDDDASTFNLSLKSLTDSSGKKIAASMNNISLTYDKNSGIIKTAQNGATTINYRKNDGSVRDERNKIRKIISDGDLNLVINSDAQIDTIKLDLCNTTNYASSMNSHSSTINAHKGDIYGQNQGWAEGELVGISFGTDGSIFGRYSNGQTKKKGQMVVAEFNNAMGLEKIGDGLYKASPNSGNPIYMDITKDGGYMTSGVLEGSNVDLAKEFTDMITTQRGFQANSKVITTSDEMLQLLKSLKR